jgi:predicted secreted protein
MAERNLSGTDLLLFIDPAGGTAYDTVVCLTRQSLKRTTSTIDAASKCGPNKLPGVQEISVEFEGLQTLDAASGKVSEAGLHDLWANKTIFSWKYGEATPSTGSVTYTGTGFISDLQNSGEDKSAASFTATLAVQGSITQTIT